MDPETWVQAGGVVGFGAVIVLVMREGFRRVADALGLAGQRLESIDRRLARIEGANALADRIATPPLGVPARRRPPDTDPEGGR